VGSQHTSLLGFNEPPLDEHFITVPTEIIDPDVSATRTIELE
jgi:hypothetical protein